MTTPHNYEEITSLTQGIARDIASEYLDTHYPDLTADAKEGNAEWLANCSGYVGVGHIARATLKLQSESINKILPHLKEILDYYPNEGAPVDQHRIVITALENPLAHETLKPLLPEILEKYSKQESKHYLSTVVKAIKKSDNDELKAIAEPYLQTGLSSRFDKPTGVLTPNAPSDAKKVTVKTEHNFHK